MLFDRVYSDDREELAKHIDRFVVSHLKLRQGKKYNHCLSITLTHPEYKSHHIQYSNLKQITRFDRFEQVSIYCAWNKMSLWETSQVGVLVEDKPDFKEMNSDDDLVISFNYKTFESVVPDDTEDRKLKIFDAMDLFVRQQIASYGTDKWICVVVSQPDYPPVTYNYSHYSSAAEFRGCRYYASDHFLSDLQVSRGRISTHDLAREIAVNVHFSSIRLDP